MSEKKSSGCLKAFVIFGVLSLVVSVLLGGGFYFLWKVKGAPSLAQMQAQIADENEGAPAGAELDPGTAIKRPVVASAPIQAGPETYAQYVKRNDVLTLVNYYSDT